MSANGAKLVADIEVPIGSTFRLSVVPQAIVRRKCEVVWRKGRVIGVKFAPTLTGLQSGTLTVTDSSSNGPHLVQLQGTGM